MKNLNQLIDKETKEFILWLQKIVNEAGRSDEEWTKKYKDKTLWDLVGEKLRQSLFYIAKATAKAGKVKRVGQWLGANPRNEDLDNGFNLAVAEQEKRMKEFFGGGR